jgi:hypothetical protein
VGDAELSVLQITGSILVNGIPFAFNSTVTVPNQVTAQAFVDALKTLFAASTPQLTFAFTDQKVLT